MVPIPGSPPNPPVPCWLGHVGCDMHATAKPDLKELPGLDRPPPKGRCAADGGHSSTRVWLVPSLDETLCIHHLRELMRRATWPFTIRFPGE